MKSDAKRDIRPRGAHAIDDAEIVGSRVLAVHRFQNAVRSRLHRQVQERRLACSTSRWASMRSSAMSRGCAGRIADALNSADASQRGGSDRPAPTRLARRIVCRRCAMPGIHVLADEHDLFHAIARKLAGLRDDRINVPREYSAPRV